MKRVNYLLTLLCLLCGTTPMMAQSFEDGGICYNVTDATNKTVEVTYNGDFLRDENSYTGDIIIPATASDGSNTYAVTSIGKYAFYGCIGLTSVTIPESVTSIGIDVFYSCTSLTSVAIPSSVESIGEGAFVNCTSLKSITIPSNVTSIGKYTFYNCTSLKSITIPSSVTSIGNEAFNGCTSLETIAILGDATNIGDFAFYNCTALKTIYVPDESVDTYKAMTNLADHSEKIKSSTFTEDGITYRITNLGEVEVTYNGDFFLGENSYTGDIVIPATTSDGSNTYAVTSIGEYAFYGCIGLTSVTIPASVESIGVGAFVYCESLTSVTIPSSVKSIGFQTFAACTSLTSVTIPASVESIGNNAFYLCSDLTSIVVENGNKVYDSRDNCNAIIETATNTLLHGCKNTVIPASVKSIGNEAFSNCIGLTSVTIPSSVKSIGNNAFYYCTGLTSVVISEGVESIGNFAFYYCTGLTTVAILGGATSIGNEAFGYCDVLETIYVPYESVETYQANENLAEHSEKIKGSIDVELKAASIGGAYASVYLPFPATLVEGDAKAYVGESLEAGTLTLARATEIAANEGFILYAENACTATLRVGATEEAATSIIEGTNTEITLTEDNRADYLVFGISNGEIGFFKPAASIGSIPANRAFLPNTGGVSAVRMQFDFGTTGIEVIENGEWRMETAPVYDLSGRRVTSPAKGSLYIRNGQKFIWK